MQCSSERLYFTFDQALLSLDLYGSIQIEFIFIYLEMMVDYQDIVHDSSTTLFKFRDNCQKALNNQKDAIELFRENEFDCCLEQMAENKVRLLVYLTVTLRFGNLLPIVSLIILTALNQLVSQKFSQGLSLELGFASVNGIRENRK